MKQEILETIREELGKTLLDLLYEHFDLLDGYSTGGMVKDNLITFDLLNDQQLRIDLAKKSFTIITFKFDWYRDPCPGYGVDSEEDVTEKCLKLIGDLADIMEVFSERDTSKN